MTRASRTRPWLFPLGFLLLAPSPAPAQFSGDGSYVYAPWTPANASTNGDGLRCLAVRTDPGTGQQKILAAGTAANNSGYSYVGTARYLTDGSFDPSYGTNGVSVVGPYKADGSAIALQDDGTAIVAGSNITGTNQGSNFFLVRCTSTGQLDTSFNGTGMVSYDVGGAKGNDQASGVAIQSSGKIVVAGLTSVFANGSRSYPFAVARFNSNGSLDTGTTGFGQAGKGGKRLGYQFTTPIPGSGSQCEGLALLPDDRILAVGNTSYDPNTNAVALVVIRYTANGDLDTSFHGSGIVWTSLTPGGSANGAGITIDPNGNCLVSGSWQPAPNSPSGDYPKSLFVARFRPDGSLDPTFNQGAGFVTVNVPGFYATSGLKVALQENGQILVGSSLYATESTSVGLALTRFNADGSLDTTFGSNGSKTCLPGGASAVSGGVLGILNDGTIIDGGNYQITANSTFRNFPMLVQFLP